MFMLFCTTWRRFTVEVIYHASNNAHACRFVSKWAWYLFMRGGPARRRVGRPISSAAAEWLGVATIRKCRVYRRGSSVFTRSFLLQNACELLRIDNAELQSPFLRHGWWSCYSMLLGILHFLLRGVRLEVAVFDPITRPSNVLSM